MTISRLQTVEWPGNVLAYDVSFTSSRPADGSVEVACDGLDPWTVTGATATQQHHLFVMGLVSGVGCTLTARVSTADGASASQATQIEVGPLPSYLPTLEVSVPATETLEPGWTLFNLSNEHAGVPYIAALVDDEGRYRWTYQYPSPVPGTDTPVSQLDDGVLIGGHALPLSYVTWPGDLVWTGPTGHHEARPSETPGRFYTLSWYQCPTFKYIGGMIVEYDVATAKTAWTWSLCEHYTPARDAPDWSHMNTVSVFPDKKALLISSRNQNAIMKIDRASGDLTWVMGYAGEVEDGFHGDFAIDEADRFLHQHDTTVLPSGHILMFDNGRVGARELSRALELEYSYNPAGGSEAHVVWQYRHDPDIFAPIWGGTQRLDNGHTLVCFGQHDDGSVLVEVSSDSRLLWELRTPAYWGVYRAQRIPEQHGFALP